MMRIDAPWLQAASSRRICSAFEARDYQIYFVGGCVRNHLLGQPVTDLDLATDATPDLVLKLAEGDGIKAIPTGLNHGTVTLVLDAMPFEVTTFRTDVETDGRKAKVAYTDNLEEDAKRRDFGMNALYAAPDGGIKDPVDGLTDLQQRKIRFIGRPEDRIQEDYLRILRFFRFHAWYADPENGIDPEGLAACAMFADMVPSLSKERITAELLKLLSASDPSLAMASMAASGVLAHTFPGASTAALPIYVYHESQLNLTADPIARLATLGQDLESYLRLSKAQQLKLSDLRKQYASAGEAGYRLAENAIMNLAINAAQMGTEIDTKMVESAKKGIHQIFPVSARDLMPEFAGKALGDRLQELEERWIASDFSLTRDELLA